MIINKLNQINKILEGMGHNGPNTHITIFCDMSGHIKYWNRKNHTGDVTFIVISWSDKADMITKIEDYINEHS